MQDKVINILQEHGINPSIQRIAIMDYLLKHRTHPNVEEVYTALFKQIPTLSRTTVYNTLRLLSEQGAAQMLTIDEKRICFDGDTSAHAHFLCRECGKLYDLPMPKEMNMEQSNDLPFNIEETHLYYKGICSKCAEKKNN